MESQRRDKNVSMEEMTSKYNQNIEEAWKQWRHEPEPEPEPQTTTHRMRCDRIELVLTILWQFLCTESVKVLCQSNKIKPSTNSNIPHHQLNCMAFVGVYCVFPLAENRISCACNRLQWIEFCSILLGEIVLFLFCWFFLSLLFLRKTTATRQVRGMREVKIAGGFRKMMVNSTESTEIWIMSSGTENLAVTTKITLQKTYFGSKNTTKHEVACMAQQNDKFDWYTFWHHLIAPTMLHKIRGNAVTI